MKLLCSKWIISNLSPHLCLSAVVTLKWLIRWKKKAWLLPRKHIHSRGLSADRCIMQSYMLVYTFRWSRVFGRFWSLNFPPPPSIFWADFCALILPYQDRERFPVQDTSKNSYNVDMFDLKTSICLKWRASRGDVLLASAPDLEHVHHKTQPASISFEWNM